MTTKTALVTGANRGIGLETARQIAHLGMRTLIGSRDASRGELAAATLRGEGLDAIAVRVDVDSTTSVREAAAWVHDEFGHLDVLVNNAGILPEATALDAGTPVDADLFLRTFQTNVFGAVRMIEQFVPLLLRAPAGRIVNVSTTMGSLTDQADPSSPYYGVVVPAYQASKAALNSLTIGLAKALSGTDLVVTSVCPGFVQTDLAPTAREHAPLTADQAAVVVADAALALRVRRAVGSSTQRERCPGECRRRQLPLGDMTDAASVGGGV